MLRLAAVTSSPAIETGCEPGDGVVPGSRAQQAMLDFGRFGWVTDPEGNRVELWQAN